MQHPHFLKMAVFGVLALATTACGSTTVDDSALLETSSSAQEADSQSANPAPTVVAAAEAVVDTAAAKIEAATIVTTTPPTTSSPTTTTSIPTAAECAAEVPLEIRIGQLMFPLITQPDFAAAADAAERGLIGGVVLIGNPTASVANDIQAMQHRSLLGELIVAVDEEGGTVQRLAGITSALPSARNVAATMTLDEAQELARAHAVAIGELGFTMNLAPVVDLDNGGFLESRTFSTDPATATEYGFATADGILAAGLTPVMKHFPGHGRGTDSHTGLPTLPELSVLEGDDLIPFVAAAKRGDLPIMIGHLVVPDLTNGKPATLSPEAIDGLLREELGFDGLVMTDAFNMEAIAATTSNAEAAEQSLAAGVDLVMLGSLAASEGTVSHVVAAVEAGTITEESITESFLRVLETRGLEICALPEDLRPNIGCQLVGETCVSGE